jgi:hypothetical protein
MQLLSARVATLRTDSVLRRAEPSGIDLRGAEYAVRDLLAALGRDVDEEGLRETPRRVAAAFGELLTHEPVELTTFPNDTGYDELVAVARDPVSLPVHAPPAPVSRRRARRLPAGRADRPACRSSRAPSSCSRASCSCGSA